MYLVSELSATYLLKSSPFSQQHYLAERLRNVERWARLPQIIKQGPDVVEKGPFFGEVVRCMAENARCGLLQETVQVVMLYEKIGDNKVHCKLCAHSCKISQGKRGFCGVRENRDGKLYTLIYGTVSSEAVDPVEKKPLYHFYPGSYAHSVGSIGCNFRCKHCQNWSISQVCLEDAYTMDIPPDELVERALLSRSSSIAWTYNEPTIWHEYTYECAKLAKEAGLGTIYVTNGYMTPDALRHIAPYLDAANIDIKAFTEKFYHDVASAKLAPVLEASALAKQLGIHEKSRINPKRKNKIGKKRVDDKNPCSEYKSSLKWDKELSFAFPDRYSICLKPLKISV